MLQQVSFTKTSLSWSKAHNARQETVKHNNSTILLGSMGSEFFQTKSICSANTLEAVQLFLNHSHLSSKSHNHRSNSKGNSIIAALWIQQKSSNLYQFHNNNCSPFKWYSLKFKILRPLIAAAHLFSTSHLFQWYLVNKNYHRIPHFHTPTDFLHLCLWVTTPLSLEYHQQPTKQAIDSKSVLTGNLRTKHDLTEKLQLSCTTIDTADILYSCVKNLLLHSGTKICNEEKHNISGFIYSAVTLFTHFVKLNSIKILNCTDHITQSEANRFSKELPVWKNQRRSLAAWHAFQKMDFLKKE